MGLASDTPAEADGKGSIISNILTDNGQFAILPEVDTSYLHCNGFDLDIPLNCVPLKLEVETEMYAENSGIGDIVVQFNITYEEPVTEVGSGAPDGHEEVIVLSSDADFEIPAGNIFTTEFTDFMTHPSLTFTNAQLNDAELYLSIRIKSGSPMEAWYGDYVKLILEYKMPAGIIKTTEGIITLNSGIIKHN